MTAIPEKSEAWLILAERRLSIAGLKAGAARTAVVELLAAEGRCLLSPREIAARLEERNTGSIASVYRTLEQLHELGLVHRLDGQDGVARYEIADPDHVHHHFFDEKTGEVTPFEDQRLDQLIGEIADQLEVNLTSHDVILRGTAIGRASRSQT